MCPITTESNIASHRYIYSYDLIANTLIGVILLRIHTMSVYARNAIGGL